MPYNANIPAAGDIPAQSQALILQNFQYLNSFVQGNANALLLTRQAVAPTVAATQVGIYNVLTGGVSSLMVKDGASAAVNILKAGKNQNGWCILPSGIKMVWGLLANVPGGTPTVPGSDIYSYTSSTGFPGFTVGEIYNAQATGTNVNAGNAPLYVDNPNISFVTVYNPGPIARAAFVFIIGS